MLTGSGSPFASVAFSPDGQRLAASSADGTLRILDATPLPEVALPPPPAVGRSPGRIITQATPKPKAAPQP